MRPVREVDIETGYRVTADISDCARNLFEQGKWDPFHIEIIWENPCADYDISIDVAIIHKGSKPVSKE